MKKIYILVLFLIVACKSTTKGQEKQNIQKDSIQKLSILFTGDFMGHMDQIKSAYNAKTKKYDYFEHFMYVSSALSKPDVAIGNLEVTLGTKPYSGYPQFSSPSVYAEAIKNAGVDILATSNNHSCDKRKKGVEKTIDILDELKIPHLGTYKTTDEKQKNSPLMISEKGFKIALLNYTYGTNGIKPSSPNVINYLKEETVLADINTAKSKNPDAIIAYVHWGSEYKNLPNAYQKKWEKFFNDNGVKIVIGAHPHVIQPMKFDKQNQIVTAYSLGNFISHQRTFPRDGGAVLKIDFIKKNDSVSIDNVAYKLTWVYEPIVNGKKSYHVLPISDFEEYEDFFTKKKDFQKMKRYIKHARKLLGEYNVNVQEYK